MSDHVDFLAGLNAAVGCDRLAKTGVSRRAIQPKQGHVIVFVPAYYARGRPSVHAVGYHDLLRSGLRLPAFTIRHVARRCQEISVRVRFQDHRRAQQSGGTGRTLEPALLGWRRQQDQRLQSRAQLHPGHDFARGQLRKRAALIQIGKRGAQSVRRGRPGERDTQHAQHCGEQPADDQHGQKVRDPGLLHARRLAADRQANDQRRQTQKRQHHDQRRHQQDHPNGHSPRQARLQLLRSLRNGDRDYGLIDFLGSDYNAVHVESFRAFKGE